MERKYEDPKVCEHSWKLVRDCEGDPGVINGVHWFQYLECRKCGDEVQGNDMRDIMNSRDWEE